jgi:DNA replication protein DnaC
MSEFQQIGEILNKQDYPWQEDYEKVLILEAKQEEFLKRFICVNQCQKTPGYLKPYPELITLFGEPEDARGVHCPFLKKSCAGWKFERNQIITSILKNKGVPEKVLPAEFETAKSNRGISVAKAWIKTGFKQGKALLLAGEKGVGKTWAVIAALRELLFKGIINQEEFDFWYIQDLFGNLRSWQLEYRELLLHRVQSVKLLVLDDLATESKTEFSQAAIDRIVYHRHGNNLPTIITTNKNPQDFPAEFEEYIGGRALDRLLEWAMMVTIPGKSLRGAGKDPKR